MFLHFYFKQSGELEMYSEGENIAPNLIHKKINITSADYQKLQDNWPAKNKNGKIEFIKPRYLIKEEKEQNKKDTVAVIKSKLGGIADNNVKDTINEILKIIEV